MKWFKDFDTQGELELKQGTAEFEYFVAKGELALPESNLAHGIVHLGNLLSFDPGCPEWMELLETYRERNQGDLEALLPNDEERYYATEAIRAYHYAKIGHLDEAISLLNKILSVKPDVKYMECWGLTWLLDEAGFKAISAETAFYTLAQALNRFPEYKHLTISQERYLNDYLALATEYPNHFKVNETFIMTYLGLIRKAGKYEQALSLAKEYQKIYPGWHISIAKGLISREAQAYDQAEAAFKEALNFDPTDLSARLEAGDMYFNTQEWEKALNWYLEILEQDPEHEWAYPSTLFCQWKIDYQQDYPDETFPEELSNLAYGEVPNHRAQAIYSKFMPYQGYLPEPDDALSNILRQLIDENTKSDSFSCATTYLEAPSNLLAFQTQFQKELKIDLSVENIPKPDPRVPLESSPWELWKFEGTDPYPALPKPSNDLYEPIIKIANDEYEFEKQWAMASRIAQEISSDRVQELLAIMIHPPALPAGKTALEWLPRIQLAAAQVISHLDDGWEGSIRKKALYTVLFGPRDWATVAAIMALTHLAMENESISHNLNQAFAKLAAAIPDTGYCCYEYPLYYHWRYLPNLFEKEYEAIADKLQEIRARE